MLTNITQYHGIVRKVIIAFGRLFSDIKIVRYDQSGEPQQTITVPIAYAPKEKWTARLEGDPSLNNTVYNVLPRLSFEITGFSYDAQRSINRMANVVCNDTVEGLTRKQISTPTPYNLDISLYVLTKTTEDGLAILEQILPVFRPEYTLSIKAINDMNLIMDVPIILNGVTVDDQYEGDFETRRVITHTYNFTAKIGLFSGITNAKLVNTMNIDVKGPNGELFGSSSFSRDDAPIDE